MSSTTKQATSTETEVTAENISPENESRELSQVATNGSGNIAATRQPQDPEAMAIWGDQPTASINNFDGDERQQFALQMLAQSASGAGGNENVMGKPFDVRYWMVHEIELTDDETGELITTYRTVLISPNHEAIAFVSAGIARGVHSIFQRFGRTPLDPPLSVVPTVKMTQKKRRIYVLVPSTDSIANGDR